MTFSVRALLSLLHKWMVCLGRLGGLVGHTSDRYACDFGEFRGQHSNGKLFAILPHSFLLLGENWIGMTQHF